MLETPARSDQFCTPLEAAEEFRAGRMLVVLDDRSPDSDGDVIIAAEAAGAEEINFMTREARGLVCLALSADRCDELRLDPMVERRTSHREVDYTISIEAAEGVTTGISAQDRALTVAVASDPESTADDLVRPGHIFPLRGRPGGVLERPGHTEAALDIARLADKPAAAVICQILNDDGSTARAADLETYAERHGLRMVQLTDLVDHLRDERTRQEATDPGELRHILGQFATGVTVVTTIDDEGEACGTTANAFTSVSLDPPLILVCLARESQTLEMIRNRGSFVANILADGQQEHSNWFARKGVRLLPDQHEFTEGQLGMPVLTGVVAHLECRVERIDVAGDHEIVLGRVAGYGHHEDRPDPLLFFQGGYRKLHAPTSRNHL